MLSIVLKGRMGNQMFQYSFCRIIAEKNNYRFYIPHETHISTSGQHIKDFFQDLDLGSKDGEIKYRIEENSDFQNFNPSYFKVENFTEFTGFFQSPKYFEGYKDSIKNWFITNTSVEVNQFLEKYDINKYCYIHVRGTDYKYSDWFLPKKYYTDAINEMKRFVPNLSFVILTDDLESSKYMFPDIECFTHEDMMVDFQLLKMSKFNIIPNSTFSWWSCWLGDKEIVVAPNNWLNYNKPKLGFYPQDIKTESFLYF
jgi:hypothetical protein